MPLASRSALLKPNRAGKGKRELQPCPGKAPPPGWPLGLRIRRAGGCAAVVTPPGGRSEAGVGLGLQAQVIAHGRGAALPDAFTHCGTHLVAPGIIVAG